MEFFGWLGQPLRRRVIERKHLNTKHLLKQLVMKNWSECVNLDLFSKNICPIPKFFGIQNDISVKNMFHNLQNGIISTTIS